MTSRFILLVAASLCAASAFVKPAAAQSDVPLRASYQGQFLPEGTELIVLSKEGRVQRDGRYQPEFVPTTRFPQSERSVLRRDRIGDSGRSNRSYDGTQSSGRLYFIYALTPDSTLYWSYSAQRDSLKYDVVNTGVMSVAPVLISEVRDDVLGRFFRKRVTVVMKGETEEEETVLADAESVEDALHQDSLAAAAIAAESTPSPEEPAAAVKDAVSPPSAASRVASASPPTEGVSPVAFWSVVILLLAAAAVAAYLARTWRAELKQVRREMFTLRDRMAQAGVDSMRAPATSAQIDVDVETPRDVDPVNELRTAANDAIAALRADLEDAELRHQQLEEDYAILEARYAALEKELDAMKV